MMSSTFAILPMSSLSTIIAMAIQRKHLLMSLLALEATILMIIMMTPSLLVKMNSPDNALILIILTFGACEACIGLACLVNLMRLKGNDLIKSSSSNKC